MKYFWFETANQPSHTFEVGSSSAYGGPYDFYDVSIRMPDTQTGSMAVHWEKGKKHGIYCGPAQVCAKYFDGTIQIGSADIERFIFN